MLQGAHQWSRRLCLVDGWFADWMRADTLGLLGIVVSLVGFVVAVRQLRKTRGVSEELARSVREASQIQFLFLLPQFRQLESEFDIGLEVDSRSVTARALSSYADLAKRIAALALELSICSEAEAGEIRAAARAASDAKHEIHRNKSKKLANITAEFSSSAHEVSRHISSFEVDKRLTQQPAQRKRKWSRGKNT